MASKHPKGYWTKERVTDEAQKYVSRNQFRENASAAYIAAKKYGILDVLFVTNGKIVHEAGYWTPERLNEEGRKYQTKGEFKKQSPTAYATAVRNGLIASMDWFIDGRRKKRGLYKKHKYSKDTVAIIIKEYKCITVTDLRKANEYAYKEARDNNWLTELGLAENKHEDGYWTPERVWTVAKQYSNKKDFYKNEPVARAWAGKYKMLGKMSWMRCPTYDELRENHDSEVYAFIDEAKKVVYVGLSIDTNQRKRAHKSDKKSAVKKYFGKNVPEPKVLMTNLTIDESTYWEDYYKKKYSKEGYTLLNVAATGLGTGSIGGISKWSSKEVVFEESRKYHSRAEFRKKAGGAYNHAESNGWLDEMSWLQTPPRPIKWTKEKVFEESHKYHYKGEFCNGSTRAYNVAKENGWLEEMTWIREIRKPVNYWTKARVFEEGRKYANQKEFKENANGAYQAAMRQGWIKEMMWLKPLPLGHISEWTRERIIEESKKYSSRSEFAQKSQTAYHHACEDKSIFMEMLWMVEKKKPDGWWNDKERVMDEGRKYQTRTAFANGSYSAWKAAKKNGWIEEMTWLKRAKL
jgi:hypothetical protein